MGLLQPCQLFPVGTVRKITFGIALYGLEHNPVDGIKQFIGAGKPSRLFQIRIDKLPLQSCKNRHSAFISMGFEFFLRHGAPHFHIPKARVCEIRRKFLLSFPV